MRTVRILSACICGALAWNLARPAEAQGPALPDSGPALQIPQPAPPPAPSLFQPVSQPMQPLPQVSPPVFPQAIPTLRQPVMYRPISYTADGPVAAPTGPGMPTTPQAPGRPTPAELAAPPQAAGVFAEAAPAGTEAAGGAFAPQMLGDSLSYFSQVRFGQPGAVFGSPGFPQPPGALIPVPSLAGSAFKMADDDSPLPQDRVSLDLNYFTDVFHGARPNGAPDLRFTRYLLECEKTFLNGDASVEVRVPIFQLDDNAGGTSTAELGDITLISKFVLVRDSASGLTVTGGLDITIPTGPALSTTLFVPAGIGGTTLAGAVVNPTIIQPWVGFYYNPSDRLYVQAFSSMAIPTSDNVPTAWFNDLGVGYHIYRAGSVDIIPTVEAHLTDGLSHQGVNAFPLGVVDTFDTIFGVHFAWSEGTILTLGYGFPWTGPQPFSSELICQLNHRF